MKRYEVTNDYIFKKIFGKEGNEEILKDLLISILEIPIKEIEVIHDVHLERTIEENKAGVLDVKAKLDNNTTVNIEMQVKDQSNMIDRSLYYWANLYSNGLYKKEDYTENDKTIVINILGFNIFEEGPYQEICRVRRDYNLEVITEHFEMHFIQIPKCKKEEIKTKLDEWMQFIGNISEKGVNIAMKSNERIKEAKEELEYLNGDEETRRIAELREKAIRDETTNLNSARKEGERLGLEKGKIEIAKKMKGKGHTIEEVVELTELSKEEVERL